MALGILLLDLQLDADQYIKSSVSFEGSLMSCKLSLPFGQKKRTRVTMSIAVIIGTPDQKGRIFLCKFKYMETRVVSQDIMV